MRLGILFWTVGFEILAVGLGLWLGILGTGWVRRLMNLGRGLDLITLSLSLTLISCEPFKHGLYPQCFEALEPHAKPTWKAKLHTLLDLIVPPRALVVMITIIKRWRQHHRLHYCMLCG